MMGAPLTDYDILFTSNTTESINLVAQSLARETNGVEPVILTTILEHSSNDLPWRTVAGHKLIRLACEQ
jgi:selenocysteine lyase/cysteine desulfurase